MLRLTFTCNVFKSTSGLDGHEWSASRPGRVTPGWTAPGTGWVGGYMGPRTGLDAMEKRKIFCPCQKSRPGSSVFQPVTQSLYRRANPAWYVGNFNDAVTNSDCIVDTGFEVFTPVVMESSVAGDITSYSLVRPNRRFGGICHHLQSQRISQARKQHEAGSSASCSLGKSLDFQRTTLAYVPEDRTLLFAVQMIGPLWTMNRKGCWRKRLLPNLKFCTAIYVETLRKITLHLIIGVPPSEIRTGHLPNTSHKCYCLSELAPWCVCVFTKCIRFPVYHTEINCN
jgi:hypothetical protein